MASLHPKKYNSLKKLNLFDQQFNYNRNLCQKKNVLIGDSFIARLEWKYKEYSDIFFQDWVNYGISGDKVQHLLWRVLNGNVLSGTNKVIISIGSNNINTDCPDIISNTIIRIAEYLKSNGSDVFICGQHPRENRDISNEIKSLNLLLYKKCQQFSFTYIPVDQLFWKNDSLNENYFEKDRVHLKTYGSKSFCENISRHMFYKKSQFQACHTSHTANYLISNVQQPYKQVPSSNVYQSNFPPLSSPLINH